MMNDGKVMEAKGKTVEEAIFNGLTQMGLGIDQVDVEILQEGKGFLGLGKSATVRLTRKFSDADRAEEFLDGLFRKMGISAMAHAEETDDMIHINVDGDSTGALIGRRGETLDSLQYLTSLVINKDSETYKRVFVDTENYRKKREETLVNLANRIAGKVAKTGRRVVLEPMNPYECRILHATLHDHPSVCTVSEGEEPYRRVIIKKKRTTQTNNK